jgi:ABC-type proline/glycine betaine transport system permease subunit
MDSKEAYYYLQHLLLTINTPFILDIVTSVYTGITRQQVTEKYEQIITTTNIMTTVPVIITTQCAGSMLHT